MENLSSSKTSIAARLFVVASLSFSLTPAAEAKTTRTANAVVVNMTGQPIVSASLSHKYSDDYKNYEIWTAILENGESTPSMLVTYNTGFGTTGKDWWQVNFVHPSETPILNTSNPTNFRAAIDIFETVASGVVPIAITAASAALATACTGVTAGLCGPAGVAATTAAAGAGAAFTEAVTNSEGTAGFKQHILRSDDEGGLVKIILLPDGKITISSPSGDSDTVYSSKKIEVTPELQTVIDKAMN